VPLPPLTRRATIARLASGALAGAAAIPRSASAQAGETIVVAGVPSTPDLTVYYADAQGMFAKAGLRVSITTVTSGSAGQLAVVGGAAQVAATNTASLAQAVAKGVPIIAIAPGSEYTHDQPSTRLQVLPDSPIRRLSDIEGKTVASNSLADINSAGLRALVDKNGGDSEKIRFVELPQSAQAAALEEHRVDAILALDPFASANVTKGWRSVALPLDGIAPMFVSAVYIAHTSWVQSHRTQVSAFARVIHDASVYVTAHWKELIPYVAQLTKLPVATLQSLPPQIFPPGLYASHIQPVIDVTARYGGFQPFPAARAILDIPLNTAP
jgi:NitT/TauT family transport system substrate-binding protein